MSSDGTRFNQTPVQTTSVPSCLPAARCRPSATARRWPGERSSVPSVPGCASHDLVEGRRLKQHVAQASSSSVEAPETRDRTVSDTSPKRRSISCRSSSAIPRARSLSHSARASAKPSAKSCSNHVRAIVPSGGTMPSLRHRLSGSLSMVRRTQFGTVSAAMRER